MSSSVCNYLFQIIMGRMLTVEEFGVLTVLFSLLNLYTVPTITITMVISRYFAYFEAKKEQDKMAVFLKKSTLYVSIFALTIIMTGTMINSFIKSYLKINNSLYVIITIIVSGITLLTPLALGAMQGLKKFLNLGFLNFIGAGLKLFLGFLFVFFGFGIMGALQALLVGALILVLIGIYMLKDYYTSTNQSNISLDKKEIIRYIYPVLLCNLSLVILTNIDMVMIKHYFSEQEVGLYSSAVLFGRIIFYVTSAIVTTMFPIVVQAKTVSKSTIGTLKKSLTYTGIFCLTGIIGLSLFPNLAVNLLLGDRYINAITYIKLIAVAMLPICLLSVLMNYYLAIGQFKTITISLMTGCILDILLISWFHKSVEQVICIMIFSGVFMLLINCIHLLLINKSKFNIRFQYCYKGVKK